MTALDFLVNACLNKEQQCSFSVSLFNSSYKWKEKNPTTHSQKKDIKYFIGHHIFLSVLWPEGTERPKSAPYCQQYFKIQLSGDINILFGTASVFYKQLKEEKVKTEISLQSLILWVVVLWNMSHVLHVKVASHPF